MFLFKDRINSYIIDENILPDINILKRLVH